MLQAGECASRADLARHLGLTRARVTQVLSLLNLAPEVVDELDALGDLFPTRIVTERRLRSPLKLPVNEQKDALEGVIPHQESPQAAPPNVGEPRWPPPAEHLGVPTTPASRTTSRSERHARTVSCSPVASRLPGIRGGRSGSETYLYPQQWAPRYGTCRCTGRDTCSRTARHALATRPITLDRSEIARGLSTPI
jgi:hypothetical protein